MREEIRRFSGSAWMDVLVVLGIIGLGLAMDRWTVWIHPLIRELKEPRLMRLLFLLVWRSATLGLLVYVATRPNRRRRVLAYGCLAIGTLTLILPLLLCVVQDGSSLDLLKHFGIITLKYLRADQVNHQMSFALAKGLLGLGALTLLLDWSISRPKARLGVWLAAFVGGIALAMPFAYENILVVSCMSLLPALMCAIGICVLALLLVRWSSQPRLQISLWRSWLFCGIALAVPFGYAYFVMPKVSALAEAIFYAGGNTELSRCPLLLYTAFKVSEGFAMIAVWVLALWSVRRSRWFSALWILVGVFLCALYLFADWLFLHLDGRVHVAFIRFLTDYRYMSSPEFAARVLSIGVISLAFSGYFSRKLALQMPCDGPNAQPAEGQAV